MSVLALCLASAIFFEARGEPNVTQRAVMSVVENRGTDVCKVVKAKGQFAFVKHGRIPKMKDKKSVEMVRKVVRNHRVNLSRKYKFFNHKRLGVRFKTPAKPVVLGNLIFY